jgi:SAM-dependent methyltransferase
VSDQERQKWDLKHAGRGFFPPEPSSLITGCRNLLPRSGGRALDLAGGSGRHSFWLAGCGFDVTLADISEAGLTIARGEAERRALALETVCADFEREPIPAGPWKVILCFHYLHRPLFGEFARCLTGDGVLVFAQPTVLNLERHPRPGRRYLLEEGELGDLAIRNHLEIIHLQEGWSAEGRHEGLLVARRQGRAEG